MILAVAYEGDDDLPVVTKLAADAGFEVGTAIDCAGKGNLDRDIAGYNNQAKGSPWLVLRDLDNDCVCVATFLGTYRDYKNFMPSRFMCFRLAVREMEAWLLADHEGFARFFGVEARWLPANPDRLADPTHELVSTVDRRSTRGDVRRAVVPPRSSIVAYGPGYDATIIEFATTTWNLERAASRSESLRRARAAVRALAASWAAVVSGEHGKQPKAKSRRKK